MPDVKYIQIPQLLGDNCVIHAGAVLGADGFGFAPNQENEYNKVAQIGNVILEDFVEIGANTCIDRATLGSTIIHKGTKLDNLIQIAHNCEIGETYCNSRSNRCCRINQNWQKQYDRWPGWNHRTS